MFYIDSHCHLTDKKYVGAKSVVENAEEAGVKIIVDAGWSYQSAICATENAEKFESVYCTVGIHPSESLIYTDDELLKLENRLSRKKCLAVGEIGLDYHYDGTDKPSQRELFEKQICLADKHKLPFVVHSRDSSRDMLDVLKTNKNKLSNGFLMHCFSESAEQAKNYLDLGAYFSFGGVITFKNCKKEDIVRAIPTDRILLETDSPYLAPEPLRGSVNEPKNVVLIYEKTARILNLKSEVLQELIADNFFALFKKASL